MRFSGKGKYLPRSVEKRYPTGRMLGVEEENEWFGCKNQGSY